VSSATVGVLTTGTVSSFSSLSGKWSQTTRKLP
jgi:hypothetical protein